MQPLLREMSGKPRIREVLPGVYHWTRVHPRIRTVVSSYYVEPAGVLIDPLIPREGLEWFEGRRPAQVVTTIRHHLRGGERSPCCEQPGFRQLLLVQGAVSCIRAC